MSGVVVDWKQIDPSKDFVFGAPKARKGSDGIMVSINVKDPTTGQLVPFVHQAPKLRIPFGVDQKSEKDYRCHFTMPGVAYDFNKGDYDGDEELVQYLKFMKAVDECVKQTAHKNSETWFKKKISIETIAEFYNPIMRDPKDPSQYSPNMKTKFLYNDRKGAFETIFHDQYHEPMEFEEVTKGCSAIPLIRAASVWFANKSFGLSLHVLKLAVFKSSTFEDFVIDTGCEPPAKKIRMASSCSTDGVPEEEETGETKD